MTDLKITDVRVLPGDSGFLIDDGKTSVLYDTGFGFTGFRLADNIKKQLGDRSLDYIFLTHSHYDHALGSVYVAQRYKDVKIVAGAYAAKIFAKPSAKAVMRELDGKYAQTCGVYEYEDLIDNLHADITADDGDVINAGDMTFTVISLPGHTRCSVGYYLNEKKLLLATETLGVYFSEDLIVPSYLIGYQTTIDSIRKAKKLDIENILLPHYGVLDRQQTSKFLEQSEKVAAEVAENIKNILTSGGSKEDAERYFEKAFYNEKIKPAYPEDAFRLNTGIMIDLIQKEQDMF